MTDAYANSVTAWIEDLKSGDGDAAGKLWERYFDRLVLVARRKLGAAHRRVEDEEDLALSAFHALCDGAAQGRFEKLENRSDLWALLVAIAGRKAIDQIRRQTSKKRGEGDVRGNSIFVNANSPDGMGFEQVIAGDPTPDFLALMNEQHQQLLQVLRDDAQRKIVQLRLAGHTNDEIATTLGISVRSVERKLKVIRDVWSGELAE